MFIFSITSKNSLDEVIPIYQLIKEVKAADNKNDVPVILVGNKCDEEDNRQVKTGKLVNFAIAFSQLTEIYSYDCIPFANDNLIDYLSICSNHFSNSNSWSLHRTCARLCEQSVQKMWIHWNIRKNQSQRARSISGLCIYISLAFLWYQESFWIHEFDTLLVNRKENK